MKREMMRFAMMYVAEQAERVFPDNEEMTVEEFIKLSEIKFNYREVVDGSRIDGIMTITEFGEVIAEFRFNIAC